MAPRLVVLQDNQFACSQTQLALSTVVEKQRRSVCKALSPPPSSQGAHATQCTQPPNCWQRSSLGSASYRKRVSLLFWIFLLNGSQSVEARSEKRRQQLMGLSFVAAALFVLALLAIRLGTCCSWFGSH